MLPLGLGGLALVLTSCWANLQPDRSAPGPSSSTAALRGAGPACQLVRHDAGATRLCGQPRRIAALSPHMLDVLLALNLQPVGYAEVDYFDLGERNAPVQAIPYLGERVTSQPINVGSRENPSLEVLVKLKPDLILREYPENYALMAQIAPTLVLRSTEKDQWQRNLRTIAQSVGREPQAEQVITHYQQRLTTLRQEMAELAKTRSLLVISSGGLSQGISIVDEDIQGGRILTELGFRLVTADASSGLSLGNDATYSIEVLSQLKADIIIVLASNGKSVASLRQEWQQTPLLKTLPAYQRGSIHFVDTQLWARIRGPIAAELILQQIRQILLPEQKMGKVLKSATRR